jgi:hypothetical protein
MELLPEKSSDLIELALQDLEKVERREEYRVEMSYSFHAPIVLDLGEGDRAVCSVCFAGAVMAMSLNTSPDKELWPEDYRSPGNKQRLYALDYFRRGLVWQGLELVCEWGHESARTRAPKIPAQVCITPYSKRSAGAFKDDMRRLAELLRREGL